MKMPSPTVVDFETMGIESRPDYPPVPVGVSIKPCGKKARYYAWGHLNGKNNSTKEQAIEALRKAYENASGILCHHGKFDIDVAEVHMGLTVPPWQRLHDTTFLLFLDDPNQMQVGLKPAAERLLGQPPEEQDAVRDWLLENQPVEGVKIGHSDKSKEPFGKYIAYAPPEIVGPYANGDCERTEALFKHLYPSIVARDMLGAYDRERRVMPVLLGMERQGVRVDVAKLRTDISSYRETMVRVETWILKRIGVPEFNIGSPDQLVEALTTAGLLDMGRVTFTATGKVSTAKGKLDNACSDKQLSSVLRYRAALHTCLSTFMVPWLAVAERSGGFVYTNWNQIKGDGKGARTGRLSSNPNFQNMPKEFDPLFMEWALIDATGKAEILIAKKLPKLPWKTLPRLPLCRGYIIPYEKGHVLIGRDFSQQEPRILAHFEDGPLMERYLEDPWTDMHEYAKEHLEATFKRPFARRPVKNVGLGIIYGQGVPSLAERNGWDIAETKQALDAILALYPGLEVLRKDMKYRARAKLPARTWGGREFMCEPPRIIKNKFKTFDYKMINTLVQGSAADDTKEAMIRTMDHFLEQLVHSKQTMASFIDRMVSCPWKMLLQVHDELVISVPAADLVLAQEWLRDMMESVEFDVKVLTEGSWSADNWAAMKNFDVRGKRVAGEIPKQRRLSYVA